ncbi:MAG: IclR family transcriptional regulator, partial [Candidatus Angelobacter sp.]
NLAPSIVQRLVKTLARWSYLEQTGPSLRYTIGYKAFQVGNSFVAQTTVHSAVLPELYALADQQINAFLGVMRGASIVYLATVQSNGPIAINHRPGAQTYLHSTAMGKALLAELPEHEVRGLLSGSPLPRLTPRTRISIAQLLPELQAIKQQGYSVSEEENRLGFFSIGAVIRDSTGSAVAVISGAVSTAGLKNQDRGRISRLVVQAARNASRRLGAPERGSEIRAALRSGADAQPGPVRFPKRLGRASAIR